eukprot:gene34690-40159_t
MAGGVMGGGMSMGGGAHHHHHDDDHYDDGDHYDQGVMYSCVELLPESRDALLTAVPAPEGWGFGHRPPAPRAPA